MDRFEPRMVVFCCHNAAGGVEGAGNLALLRRIPKAKVVELPCSSKIEVVMLLKAFELGADAVYVIACPEGACHFLEGNLKAKKRVHYTKKLLDEIGLGGDRLRFYHLSASMQGGFEDVVDDMTRRASEMGDQGAPTSNGVGSVGRRA